METIIRNQLIDDKNLLNSGSAKENTLEVFLTIKCLGLNI
jgi:hypothetical protein